MQTFTVVLCTLIALATATTTTEAPRDDVTVTSTFVGDLATATPGAILLRVSLQVLPRIQLTDPSHPRFGGTQVRQ